MRQVIKIFTTLKTIEDIHNKVEKHALTFLYISQPNCSVCHGLLPQIEEILSKFPKIHTYQVDASKVKRIAGDFQVFTAPTLLLFVNGREYIREARFVQTGLFEQKVSRIYKEWLEH